MKDSAISDTTGLVDCDEAMQPYLDIAKNDGGNMNLSTLRSLILKILADPEIFCGFDEFKGHCSFSDRDAETVASSALFALANTLDLFSYGTLRDFANKRSETSSNKSEFYLPLNDPAVAKLAQLTVMTCVQNACWQGETRLSYSVLADALGYVTSDGNDGIECDSTTPSTDSWIRNVEDVLIRCLYSKALKGKLCQKSRSFGWETESLPVVVSRDVDPTTQIPLLLSALQDLGQRLEASGAELAQAEGQVTQRLEEADQYWKAVQDKRKTAQAESTRGAGMPSRYFGSGSGQGGGGPGGTHWHDSSGANRATAARSSKRSRPGVGFTSDLGFRM